LIPQAPSLVALPSGCALGIEASKDVSGEGWASQAAVLAMCPGRVSTTALAARVFTERCARQVQRVRGEVSASWGTWGPVARGHLTAAAIHKEEAPERADHLFCAPPTDHPERIASVQIGGSARGYQGSSCR
jgi:hypothetical protein